MTRWAYLDHPKPIPFAHRGGADEFPENTMAAFEGAVRMGYRYLETDVRVTSDGVLTVFHDEALDRVTDGTGRLEDHPWSAVCELRVDGERVPRLEDVLCAWPDIRVNIDVKQDAGVAPLVEAIDRTQAHDRVCVAAFSDRRLARFRALSRGRVCTAMGPATIARLRAASHGLPTWPFSAACAQVPVRYRRWPVVDGRFVAAAHRRGLEVHVWTVDEPEEIDRLLDLGVDGIMTDRPTVLKDVLRRRGQWH